MTAPRSPLVLAVVNPKGGAGKTTAAAFVAHALHERGRRVLAVDADRQGSLFTWHQAAGFPFSAMMLPSSTMRRELARHGVGDLYDAVVVDTPGTEHDRRIVVSAITAASHVLVPVAPSPIEYERLRTLRAVLDDAAAARPDESWPTLGVLLVRTVGGAASTQVYREAMAAGGWRVLRAAVARRERFAQAFGGPVVAAVETGYGDAVAELLEE